MRLYHGSTSVVNKPDVAFSRRNLDFGQGFYLTSYQDQAERWALRKARIEGGRPIVNVYEIDSDFSNLKLRLFPENNADWVEFVCRCRKGEQIFRDYDLVIGGVADDKVYEAVNMYFRGFWDMETTLSALAFYERNDQFCFVSQEAIDSCLKFVEHYEVANADN